MTGRPAGPNAEDAIMVVVVDVAVVGDCNNDVDDDAAAAAADDDDDSTAVDAVCAEVEGAGEEDRLLPREFLALPCNVCVQVCVCV